MLSEEVDKGKVYADCCPIDGNMTLPGYQYRAAIHKSILDMLETNIEWILRLESKKLAKDGVHGSYTLTAKSEAKNDLLLGDPTFAAGKARLTGCELRLSNISPAVVNRSCIWGLMARSITLAKWMFDSDNSCCHNNRFDGEANGNSAGVFPVKR